MNVSEEGERVWHKAFEVFAKDGTVQKLRKKSFPGNKALAFFTRRELQKNANRP